MTDDARDLGESAERLRDAARSSLAAGASPEEVAEQLGLGVDALDELLAEE